MKSRIAQAEAVCNVVVVMVDALMKNFHRVAPHPNNLQLVAAGHCPSPLHSAIHQRFLSNEYYRPRRRGRVQ